MTNYKTPGVYVEELSLLPPSVAQVETAIPAFIGYTQMAKNKDGENLVNKPTRIKSLLEYEMIFGKEAFEMLTVTLNKEEPYMPLSVTYRKKESPYRMYNSLRLYFANGGGPCFIVSVGTYGDGGAGSLWDAVDDYAEIKKGLDAIRKIDEITLILFPEADKLTETTRFDLYKDALAQCAQLQDRFCIFDVAENDLNASSFRNSIGTNNLSYGAAYFPFLNTSIPYLYRSENIFFSHAATNVFKDLSMDRMDLLSSILEYQAQITTVKDTAEDAKAKAASLSQPELFLRFRPVFSAAQKALENADAAVKAVKEENFSSNDLEKAREKINGIEEEGLSTSSEEAHIKDALSTLVAAGKDLDKAIKAILAKINTEIGVPANHNDRIREFYNSTFRASVRNLLNDLKVKMPPSGAIAGVYATVDGTRGVWKSPANVSLNMVTGPSVKIDAADNDNFNVHSTGKSINVIRSFTGKGTLVWGARTLDGNSNEWKYISVRRFYIMVEESVKEASERFVFEPNDANTWVKVKAMIENFLVLQWRAGALMGSKPQQAFFVKIGLGETMTQDDVLNGKMIVEIGLAVTRPAEFIILRFSHKMVEA